MTPVVVQSTSPLLYAHMRILCTSHLFIQTFSSALPVLAAFCERSRIRIVKIERCICGPKVFLSCGPTYTFLAKNTALVKPLHISGHIFSPCHAFHSSCKHTFLPQDIFNLFRPTFLKTILIQGRPGAPRAGRFTDEEEDSGADSMNDVMSSKSSHSCR